MTPTKLVALLSLLPITKAFVTYNTLESLPLDENGRLAQHLLIFPSPEINAGQNCGQSGEATWRSIDHSEREFAFVSGEFATLFGLLDNDSCGIALCLERGSQPEHLQHWNHRYQPSTRNQFLLPQFNKWYSSTCQAAEIGFVSYNENPISISWIDESSGQHHYQGELIFGERHTAWRTSFLGHVFYLEDKVTKQPAGQGTYKVQYNSFYVIGVNVPGEVTEKDVAQQEGSIERTLNMEYGRSRVVQRTFTKTGFERAPLSKLDPYVWGSIQSYYYNNKQHGAAREEWHGKGVYVNWWEVEPVILQMPWQLKTMWHDRLQVLVEEWIGGYELEKTDIYGMRTYQKGARLLSHVDRSETHAASMIVNIDQSPNISWPVEIYDHADHMHEVDMSPGDLVFYESAKCLHARMKPLPGEFYTNLFVHYRPMGDEKWYKKSNPTAAPVPISQEEHDSFVSDLPKNDDGTIASIRTGTGGTIIHTPVLQGGQDLYQYWVDSASMSTCGGH
mmetsp:Transcript_10135/g.12299  ORF Transcript_10135/g.12299 Transcript_10135/m.12299 type:complete len:504 (-) Transcript_10135:91-1602(-)